MVTCVSVFLMNVAYSLKFVKSSTQYRRAGVEFQLSMALLHLFLLKKYHDRFSEKLRKRLFENSLNGTISWYFYCRAVRRKCRGLSSRLLRLPSMPRIATRRITNCSLVKHLSYATTTNGLTGKRYQEQRRARTWVEERKTNSNRVPAIDNRATVHTLYFLSEWWTMTNWVLA